MFPNSILLFFGDHAEMFQVFPDGVEASITLHTLFAYEPIETEDQRLILEASLDFFFEIVSRQDYTMAAGIQRRLASGANDSFLLGRCEAITQAMHIDYETFVGA